MASRFSTTATVASTALLSILPAAGLVTPSGATEPFQPTLQSHDGRLALVQGADGAHVERDGKAVTRLPAEAERRLSTIASLRRGWVAAGVLSHADRSELTVVAGGTSSFQSEPVRVLPSPPTAGRLTRDPVLLVEHGRLVGLAWLEGSEHRTLEMRAARWEGSAWGAVERVAGRAAGSQMALTGDVLEDGSWLVAWAAYDGGDTEILWSLRAGGTWSAAARLHDGNEVHDIVPEVVAIRGGALAAWSRFDGDDYRLRVARFDGSRWQTTPFVGGRGSLRPAFVHDGRAVYLLHKVVAPAGWTVVELDGEGRPLREAAVPEDTAQRPLLVPTGGPEILLRWPSPDDATRERRAPWESRP